MKAVVYACVTSSATATPSIDVLTKFDEFRAKWGHVYVGTEYRKRLNNFEKTLEQIEKLQRQELGTAIYSHLSPFAHLSRDEMSRRFGFVQSRVPVNFSQAPELNISLSESLDWVAKGAVNPIKDQGSCGSCWAFSTACNLEGAGFVSSSKLVSVSEQDIVDCDHNDDGCDGGLPSSALTWSSKNGGVASEQAYPYTARDGSCRRNVGAIIHNQGYQQISRDETQIAQALETYGPLSIAVDANGFNGYRGGVLRNPSCSKTELNHAINIVGFGVDQMPYWKLRNSWGTVFGEEGYIRVYRGDCTCGVCEQVVTATGVTVSGAPNPPGPAPTPPGPSPNPPGPVPPSPCPPGPSPCRACTWSSDCSNGEHCIYASWSATSGCCSSGNSRSPYDSSPYDYYNIPSLSLYDYYDDYPGVENSQGFVADFIV